jgi:DNA-binding transcriptional ArsR family regulator
MSGFPDIAAVASLIGEPARSVMLSELADGRALTAGELAARAGVSASTASAHLSRLVSGGLLVGVAQGRHRYYRLASRQVAEALEGLAVLAPPPAPRGVFSRSVLSGLRFARSCYGHLAGRLGVDVRGRLVELALIVEDGAEHRVTPAGERWFGQLGVDVEAARRARRAFARPCIDWSERRPHLAGSLGDSMLTALVGRDWLRRQAGERTLELTPAGRRWLEATLGLTRCDPRAGEPSDDQGAADAASRPIVTGWRSPAASRSTASEREPGRAV